MSLQKALFKAPRNLRENPILFVLITPFTVLSVGFYRALVGVDGELSRSDAVTADFGFNEFSSQYPSD